VPCRAKGARHDIAPNMKSWKEDPPLFLITCLFLIFFILFSSLFNHWAEIKIAIMKLLS